MARQKLVESIPAAATLLSTTPDVVKRAKQLGCPAFKPGNRIAVDELDVWLQANAEKMKAVPTDDGELPLKDQKLNEEIRKLRLQNDEKEKKLIAVTEFQRQISEMASEVQKRMYALPSRAPELAGLSVPDIETKLTAWIDGVVEALGKE